MNAWECDLCGVTGDGWEQMIDHIDEHRRIAAIVMLDNPDDGWDQPTFTATWGEA